MRYDATAATDSSAVLYFVSIIVFGMFVVVNLFVAILLHRMTEAQERGFKLYYEVSNVTVRIEYFHRLGAVINQLMEQSYITESFLKVGGSNF